LSNTAIGVWIVEIRDLGNGANDAWDLEKHEFQPSRDGKWAVAFEQRTPV
jgi:hypothetical protein